MPALMGELGDEEDKIVATISLTSTTASIPDDVSEVGSEVISTAWVREDGDIVDDDELAISAPVSEYWQDEFSEEALRERQLWMAALQSQTRPRVSSHASIAEFPGGSVQTSEAAEVEERSAQFGAVVEAEEFGVIAYISELVGQVFDGVVEADKPASNWYDDYVEALELMPGELRKALSCM